MSDPSPRSRSRVVVQPGETFAHPVLAGGTLVVLNRREVMDFLDWWRGPTQRPTKQLAHLLAQGRGMKQDRRDRYHVAIELSAPDRDRLVADLRGHRDSDLLHELARELDRWLVRHRSPHHRAGSAAPRSEPTALRPPPIDRDAWAAVGMTGSLADAWHAHAFAPAVAAAWRAARISPPLAREFASARFRPHQAMVWIRHRWSAVDARALADVVPESAWAAWIEVGPAAAGFARLGISPDVALRWRDAGWTPEQLGQLLADGCRSTSSWRHLPPTPAVAYHRAGFRPVDATRWIGAGLAAEQAAPWQGTGTDPHAAARWIRAGLPSPADVAPWVDAGLLAQEAAEWRRHGFAAAEAGAWVELAGPERASRLRSVPLTPTEVARWDDAGLQVGTLFGWLGSGGWTLELAMRWARSGFDADAAWDWRVERFTLEDAIAWRDAGCGSAEVAATVREAEPDLQLALEWAAAGVDGPGLVRLRSAGVSPADAAAWAAAGFGAKALLRWRGSFPDPLVAAGWADAGCSPDAAVRWAEAGIDAGRARPWVGKWKVVDAVPWIEAGWDDPLVARRYEAHGWEPAAALVAERARVERTGEHRGLSWPIAFSETANRGRRTADALLGTPRSAGELDRWVGGGSPDGVDLGWHVPAAVAPPTGAGVRYRSVDVPALLAHAMEPLADASGGWEQLACRLARRSQRFLVDASDADPLLHGENPPRSILSDLHLPYPLLTVVFSAEFELGATATQLPSWDPADADRTSLSYEPWLADLRAGGALNAVTLLQADGHALDDRVLWWIRLANGQRLVVPGRRSRSALGGGVVNLAAHIAFAPANWSSHPPVLRHGRGDGRGGGSRTAVAPGRTRRRSIEEVVVRRARNVRNVGPGFAGPAPSAHLRRGHWRRQRCGPTRDWHYEWRWIAPTYVGRGHHGDHPERVYRLSL